MEAAIFVLVVFLIVSIIFTFLARYAIRPKVWSLENGKKYLAEMSMMEGESIEIENEHIIQSFDGYEMYVGFVPGDVNNKHYVIITHGYTSNRYGVYKFAALYRKMGYNSIIYDNRGHGANKPTVCTFGLKEAKDLMAVIEDTYQRYGTDIKLGLHGESMGSGIQITALAYKPKIDFIVNDCGYADILNVLRWKCTQEFHLPGWFADIASIYARIFYGYSFHQVRPIDNLPENEIPICFVHGEADAFVHMQHSLRMKKATKGYSELHLYPEVEHAASVEMDTARYMTMLIQFLEKVYPEDAPVIQESAS